MTTRAPAAPSALPTSIASIAACASATRRRDDHALAGREAVGLDDDRRAALGDVGARRRRVGERPVLRGRDPVPRHERLREILRALELGGGPRRTEDPEPRGAERVDDAGGERRLRADDRQRDLLVLRERDEVGDRACAATVGQLRLARVPALPGATNTFATRGDCATFHASACSRPPPPMTRTFMPIPVRFRRASRRILPKM